MKKVLRIEQRLSKEDGIEIPKIFLKMCPAIMKMSSFFTTNLKKSRNFCEGDKSRRSWQNMSNNSEGKGV